MGFVNEFILNEDIEILRLRETYRSLLGREVNKDNPLYKVELTIDRNRSDFVWAVGQGFGDAGNRTMFLLRFDGHDLRFDLNLVSGSSRNIKERPFMRIWDLAYLVVPAGIENRREEILEAIKDALTVYGYRGASKQIPNTIVKFNF